VESVTTQIAGRLSLIHVMELLADRRPVFHSEADFQFAFAQLVTEMDSEIRCRLEVPQDVAAAKAGPGRGEYLDLACHGPSGATLIEFKYATREWRGSDAHGEAFHLRNHAAYDLTRRYFVHDISRLERFTQDVANTNGLALLLSNEPTLWNQAPSNERQARFHNFRIHDAQTLGGHLAWGSGDAPRYDAHLTGTYSLNWHNYAQVDGMRLRWLGVPVGT
jgi:hypothetical protein